MSGDLGYVSVAISGDSRRARLDFGPILAPALGAQCNTTPDATAAAPRGPARPSLAGDDAGISRETDQSEARINAGKWAQEMVESGAFERDEERKKKGKGSEAKRSEERLKCSPNPQ
jgi:hypothetical protein